MTAWHEPRHVTPERMTRFDWLLLIVLVALNLFLLAYRVVW